ncbi:hypothetical protein VFPFJ_07208 [Purpureocillium lilacinum]|uniref:Uncharacterized protein n=1 Tax=Purpureocillium lilacinum TaxID=33203 RepID=A0A179GPK6_PURLI|nr:hypothetical protein VFPFJ_07208 [Purpureocillium lilacinum]OAQ79857.1 hypothetical protein VFPBJ_05442 [Purpureocillium lilacinum]OAQ88743.1 hypothetical protein VFPFJ_07208 [Purpureocillium lilacinum]
MACQARRNWESLSLGPRVMCVAALTRTPEGDAAPARMGPSHPMSTFDDLVYQAITLPQHMRERPSLTASAVSLNRHDTTTPSGAAGTWDSVAGPTSRYLISNVRRGLELVPLRSPGAAKSRVSCRRRPAHGAGRRRCCW